MITYRDRTFCLHEGCYKFRKCHKALTVLFMERAEKAKLPIAVYTSTPDCYENCIKIATKEDS